METNASALILMQIKCDISILIWILVTSYSARSDEVLQKQLEPITIWTELNGEAILPCNTSVPSGDKINMILWFKDNTGIPFYSYDIRGVEYAKGVHMVISNLEKRCTLITTGVRRSSLKIYNITHDDVGLYKCRVDLLNSPTQHQNITLSIADSPSLPVIELRNGSEVSEIVGPFHEGESIELKCSVHNSNPSPRITWWMEDQQLNAYMAESELKISSHLKIRSITRSYNAKLLHCRVNVAGITQMLYKVVRLNIYVKPLVVSILNGNNVNSEGESAKFVCDCFGSNPEAVISWLLDGKPIRSSAITVMHSNNTTTSTLTIRVDSTFHSKSLNCRCENPEFPGFFLEDKKILQVSYKPKVQILRSKHSFNRIKEGDDISLECSVDANPPASIIHWYHNGKLKAEMENKTLHNLRKIALISEGEYECEAFNQEGQSRSSKLIITILHAPFCQEGYEKQSIMIALHETVIMQCEVETGTHNGHVQFYWTLNNTVNIEQVSGDDQIQSDREFSMLKYTPKTPEDFGDIACWAENDIGPQKVPCYFHLSTAQKPSKPKNCETSEGNDSFKISCEPGPDGGLRQYFVLEIRLANSSADDITNEISDQLNDQASDLFSKRMNKPFYKMQKESPVFDVYNLGAGLSYVFMLYAINAKGRSEPIILAQEAKHHSKNIISSGISASMDPLTIPPIYIAIMVLILLIASLVIMTAVVLACRSQTVVSRNENANELNNFRIAYSDVDDKRASSYETEF